jgi:hypothetical protein
LKRVPRQPQHPPPNRTILSSSRPVFGSKPFQIRSTPQGRHSMWRAGQSRRVFQQNRLGCRAPEGNTLSPSFPKRNPAGPHVDSFCVFGRAGAKRSTHSYWLSSDTAFRSGVAALNHRPAPLCPPGTISSGLPRTQRSGCLCPLSRLKQAFTEPHR